MGRQSVVGRLFRRMKRTEEASPTTDVMIVRRGMSTAYYFFLQAFARANRIELVQDRRTEDRRGQLHHVSGERRKNDRRGPLSATWGQGDFVVVTPPRQLQESDPDLEEF